MKPFNLRALAIIIAVGTVPNAVSLCIDFIYLLVSDLNHLPIGIRAALITLSAIFLLITSLKTYYLHCPPMEG